MSFSYLKKLPTPAEIREQYPLSERGKEIKRRKDQALRDIFTGKSDKFLVVIGPCSADNEDAVCDYISRLSRVSEKVKDRIEIVPRIYTYKPRTNGDGYKGIAFQPNPEERPDLVAGLIAIRRLQMRSIEEFGLPAADEMLYPENWGYVEDLLSYVAIGARSVEDQHHRQTGGHEEPHQRRLLRYAELHLCGTASPALCLCGLRSGDFRQSACPCDSAGRSK